MTAPLFSATDVPAVVTELALKRYAEYLVRRREKPEAAEGISGTTLEEALAPLYLLHGNTFTSAIGIAIHGAEHILRCVVRQAADSNEEEGKQQQHQDNQEGKFSTNRCAYMVGDHCILSLFYCSCRAYGYSCIKRQEASTCKHLLALRIALLLEENGLATECIREKRITTEQFQEMVQRLL
ncbi:hypothetical protein, conserved [Trypanosoma brucei gambiense DAL972]|uniref:SWIM-type domain-containing protein n=2 Tax=Trypanosoma brucei TaxID=5691 RepID=D0A433_TRYB9|nr:hypothetical protein, conserved [Trypanosoma brucei gambiense DAL972]RHW69922.1 hypothetical protein DPX39_100098900 [Trypanosoma brucei equiperdum]CBH16027.1 hypothetical protein, conserved [Trypanosoma brucei gambiense DAL972]|eukprot:XP_011778291.1 hypothetical protein, conserved [Trypanosoma brucei gambiense DAL972]